MEFDGVRKVGTLLQHSCRKVMFSQAYMKNSVHPLPSACCDTHPPQCMLGYTHPCPVHAGIHTPGQTPPMDRKPPWADSLGRPPPHACIPPTAIAVDGMHPTGMHSCYSFLSVHGGGAYWWGCAYFRLLGKCLLGVCVPTSYKGAEVCLLGGGGLMETPFRK